MSTSPGPFAFHVEFVSEQPGTPWWKDSLIGDAILRPLARDGELSKAGHLSLDLENPKPVRSTRDLIKASTKWGKSSVVAMYAGSSDAPSWQLHLRLAKAGPCITLQVASDPKGAIRKQFDTWLAEWSRGLAEFQLAPSIGWMSPVEGSYPRPRPPVDGTAWPLGNLDLYLGRKWHAAHAEGKEVFQRIRKAPLARGVHRIDVGKDVMRISFDCDLADDASVQEARAFGETWLRPLVPTEIEAGWNEEGDEMIIPKSPKDREPFTFFDEHEDENIGYWALVRDPEDGSVDEERWKKLAAIARAHAMKDRTPVRAVRLIVPVRKEAVALLKRATKDGFDMVLYPGGDGVFWRVYP